MATVKPFAALRPRSDLAHRICELPYDVMSSDEARALADGNPLSFLHVSKPEIDLPPGTDPYAPAVYAKGRENLDALRARGALYAEASPCFYLYRQIMGNHCQTGLVATAGCQDYLDGTIRRHEFTRPDKEDDRVRHMEALNAQTGPVFLTYRADKELDAFVTRRVEGEADVDFTARDGVRHTAWTVRDTPSIERVESVFQRISKLYVADGHHRSAAAVRVFQSRQGAGQSSRFLAVIFPHDQMQILPYNRVLKDLNGHKPSELIQRLKAVFDFQPQAGPQPSCKHELCCYLEGRWHTLRFRKTLATTGNAIETLDVSLLQHHVLSPIFGIDNPRTSRRISFVGGIRGPSELERLVNGGDHACAFSMYATPIEDLMDIADANGIMPPKSTWFEPKLRDAMFCHLL
jgi:uncharacterized protein (DUF1015 family)